MAIVSRPEAQYLFTVTPATSFVFKPINAINLAIFKPCSASGVALPTITSSILDLSRLGILALIGGTIASLFTAVIVGMLI